MRRQGGFQSTEMGKPHDRLCGFQRRDTSLLGEPNSASKRPIEKTRLYT